MVVGYLRGVEHALGLLQRFATNGLDELSVRLNAVELGLIQPVERLRALGVDIVGEVLRINTGVGGIFLLVQTLNEVERHLGRIAELAVTIHLQRGKVVQLWGLLLALFLLNLSYLEGFALDGGKGFFALFLRGELSLGSRKSGIAINGGQYPVGLGLKVLDLLLTVHDERQGWRLHTTDGQHLTVLTVLKCVQTGGVHTQQPVANGAAQACQVQGLVIALILQAGKTLLDGFVGHRRNPQSLNGAGGLGLLHYPSLDKLSLLTGVATVHDTIGLLHQALDNLKLLLDTLVVYQLNAKTLGYHG